MDETLKQLLFDRMKLIFVPFSTNNKQENTNTKCFVLLHKDELSLSKQ